MQKLRKLMVKTRKREKNPDTLDKIKNGLRFVTSIAKTSQNNCIRDIETKKLQLHFKWYKYKTD